MKTRFIAIFILAGCLSTAPVESHIGQQIGDFAYRTRDEMRAKANRHQIRERHRAKGRRVCEEGEWPQRWAEDCNTCYCEVGSVRTCTLVHCHNRRKKARALAEYEAQHPTEDQEPEAP